MKKLLRVGILTHRVIKVIFNNPYQTAGGETVVGEQLFTISDSDKVRWGDREEDLFAFNPTASDATFTLCDVVIGIDFHWEKKEDQTFVGALEIRPNEAKEALYGINVVDVEDYLCSVISSEMKSTAHPELLKAHAVISRSWVLSQINPEGRGHSAERIEREFEADLLKWYDKEDHTLFHVCADDHCQRYQGLTREITPEAKAAVEATKGEVLMYQDDLCDARFYKCCGGALEKFSTCWEDQDYPYLLGKKDTAEGDAISLDSEKDAEEWITSSPDAFCNTTDKEVLAQVLNDYDYTTTDFYRWEVTYSQEELSKIIGEKLGEDIGDILDLIPLHRGTSGRLDCLQIVGSKKSFTVGKELEIRRLLSPSHLYSSAFVVSKEETSANSVPATFTLTGAGWGHGVGLCQIGAAVMSTKGYRYDEILLHYYPNTHLERI